MQALRMWNDGIGKGSRFDLDTAASESDAAAPPVDPNGACENPARNSAGLGFWNLSNTASIQWWPSPEFSIGIIRVSIRAGSRPINTPRQSRSKGKQTRRVLRRRGVCSVYRKRKETTIAIRGPIVGITESVHFESRTSESKQMKSLNERG